jgi:hypothetical protein
MRPAVSLLSFALIASVTVPAGARRASTSADVRNAARSGDPGYTGVVDTLLKACADLASEMPDGKTALALAQESGNTRFVKLLRGAERRRAGRR